MADLDGRMAGKGQVERIVAEEVPQGILSVHRCRYRFAQRYCASNAVLDVACGTGYGSVLLAEVATSVTGADLDTESVDYARSAYHRPGLSFRVEDAHRLSFPDGAFDTVVSFETIEHLGDIERYLCEVRRVLKAGGIYLVSTPRVARTTRRPRNPHHTIEFAARDLRALLEAYFADVELYGQIRVQSRAHRWMQRLDVLGIRYRISGTWRRRINRALGTSTFEDMEEHDQRIVKDELENAHDMIAVCRR